MKLKDPGAVLELIAVVELGVVAGLLSSDPSGTSLLPMVLSLMLTPYPDAG